MATTGDISDLDVLSYGSKPLVPKISMSRAKRSGVVTTNVNGGLSRQRKKYYNNPFVVSAVFDLLKPGMQDFLQLFFNRNEGKKFICYLSADRPIVEPYVVQVLSEWEESDINAINSTLTLSMEVISVRCPELDEYLFSMYQCAGNDLYSIQNCYKEIVKAMPND